MDTLPVTSHVGHEKGELFDMDYAGKKSPQAVYSYVHETDFFHGSMAMVCKKYLSY